MKINKDFGSIMVIVPHEDDELLLTAGIIRNAVKNEVPLSVVIATNGDNDFDNVIDGAKRLPETLSGLSLLGVSKENVTFLGYADTGFSKEKSLLYNLYFCKDENKIFKGRCCSHTYSIPEKVEFHFEKYNGHADYCRKSFYNDIRDCIKRDMPQNIFTTSQYDTHGDHSGLYYFIIDALKEIKSENYNYSPNIFIGIVHSRAGDDQWPLQTKKIEPFSMPINFEDTCSLKWENRVSFEVPKEMQPENLNSNMKYSAISKHVTALKPDAIDFLYSFVKKDEIFWNIRG